GDAFGRGVLPRPLRERLEGPAPLAVLRHDARVEELGASYRPRQQVLDHLADVGIVERDLEPAREVLGTPLLADLELPAGLVAVLGQVQVEWLAVGGLEPARVRVALERPR